MAAESITIDTSGTYYRDLNQQIRDLVAEGVKEFTLTGVKGQRYIGTGLTGDLVFRVEGTPGQDLGAFMKGPRILVEGNAQDGVGNTMDEGAIEIHGMSGDVLGYGMRGGHIYVKSDVGYRVGIHMKAYREKLPVIVIGGKAGDFLGEYMAGGVIVLLGMFSNKPYAPICGRSLGTGMHGGMIYIRGPVPEEQLGPNLTSVPVDEQDMRLITDYVAGFANAFDESPERILAQEFYKVSPYSHRPYGNMYCPC